jgi:hypothetical protein
VICETTDHQISCLRHFVDRRTSSENVSIGEVEAQIGHTLITKTDGKPISIRIRQACRAKLVRDGGRIEREAAANGPVWLRAIGRPDTTEPGSMPLLGLMGQNGAVRPVDLQIFYDAPVCPLNLG